VRYTQRLAETDAVASVGSKGDSYDNAMTEAFNSLYKAELVRNRGPWRGLNDLEIATVEYIDWYNHRRLHGELGHVPPAEYEALHAMTQPVTATLETSQSSLHQTRYLIVCRGGSAQSLPLIGLPMATWADTDAG
jgi:putative transposase